ncbi:MAG: proline--tRNA ligase [Candidatus Micrarchaeota archaeon]|nr:proline--tRNA ligase [Candidatus Micrarchaeota archaeon]
MELTKAGNFSEWYSKMMLEAGIVDIRYPVKGMPVYMGWGFRAMDLIFRQLEELLDRAGHDKLLFPIAIPESVFNKEAEHIKGFADEVLWVTHGGLTPLEDKLVLRPTSETAMYPMFALWIRSHGDLPIKVYQTTTVYRHETKATRPLMRGREVYWNEAHTAHATYEEAVAQVEEGINIYADLYTKLCIPFVVTKRPDHDKFPGADYTYAFDTIMPDGKTLQIGTVHNLGTNFSKPYDVKYSDAKGEMQYASQTSYGVSMRALAAVISVHGDSKGLKFPFDISPIQIVFVPIYSKGNNNEVDAQLKPIYERLSKQFRCIYDGSDRRPGDKFYRWELKGVPIRIEAGARDLSEGKVTVVDRNGTKQQVPMPDIDAQLKKIVEAYHEKLRSDAQAFFDSHIFEANSLKELLEQIDEKRGIIKAGWCGSLECADKLKGQTIAILGKERGVEKERKCVVCGRNGWEALLAKTY